MVQMISVDWHWHLALAFLAVLSYCVESTGLLVV